MLKHMVTLTMTENTHLWGKNHSMADLQISSLDLAASLLKSNIFSLLVKSSPVQLEISCTMIIPPNCECSSVTR